MLDGVTGIHRMFSSGPTIDRMKRPCLHITLVFALLLPLIPLPLVARLWTSAAGTRMEAEYVKIADKVVHLKTPDGRLLEVPVNQLSLEDQQYLKALAAGGGDDPLINGPFTEEFTEVAEKWWKWSPNMSFVDGFAEAKNDDGIVWLEWTRPMKEDFEISLVLSRSGPHTYPLWDFGISLMDTGVSCGVLLGAEEHTVFVTTKSPDNMPGNPTARDVESKSSPAGSSTGGTLTMTRRGDRLSVKFVSDSGRPTTLQSVTIPKDLAPKLLIQFGGVPTTPRRIDRVTIGIL